MTVFTGFRAIPELSKVEALQEKLVPWYLIIQDYYPSFQVFTESLRRPHRLFISKYTWWDGDKHQLSNQNFKLPELSVPQRSLDVWAEVVYALDSGGVKDTPLLQITYTSLYLMRRNIVSLLTHTKQNKEKVAQYVIPECSIPIIYTWFMKAWFGHLWREHICIVAAVNYYWFSLLTAHTSKYIKCA